MKVKEIVQLEHWKKKKLFGFFFFIVTGALFYIGSACISLYDDQKAESAYWDENLYLADEVQKEVDLRSKDAVHVSVGTYVENLKEINIKDSYFRGVYEIWFRWTGSAELDMAHHFDVYKGNINELEVLKEVHEDELHYQLVRADISVTKNFWTMRFPLESHQLRMYVKANMPIEEVVFVKDEGSGINDHMGIQGYELIRTETNTYAYAYESKHGDPSLEEGLMVSEYVTAMEINRSSWGLYVKCFIALVGTITWVMIALYICSYHHVDPLTMVPAALFGTVTNIMVGANLLPDALEVGLLEYTNVFGIMTILVVAIIIINVNRIRNKWQDKEFASFFGRVMFYTILFFIVIGNLLLPACAYMF